MRLIVWTVALGLSGCVSLSVKRKPADDDSVQVSPPGEDGTRYVAISSGRRTAPATLKRKWTRVASAACDGDYVLMSEGQSAQRRAGVITGRTHEGFVRCLIPAQVEATEQVQERARAAAASG
ncbi:MAG: hypothetical protein JKY37_06965 [Nannocystaceae bacterium]|nr:hypothetical protein [Nannocystaceae bacterium]